MLPYRTTELAWLVEEKFVTMIHIGEKANFEQIMFSEGSMRGKVSVRALDQDPELGTVLLHEFGHALGLWHNDIPQVVRSPDRVHGNDGVMRSVIGANFPALREWRRDDLDGLAALYGPLPAVELARWDDGLFLQSPAGRSVSRAGASPRPSKGQAASGSRPATRRGSSCS